jgi:hypothetical protein
MHLCLTENEMPQLRQVWEQGKAEAFLAAITLSDSSIAIDFDGLWEHVMTLDKPEGELARLINSGKDIVHLEDPTPDVASDAEPGDVYGGSLCGIPVGGSVMEYDPADPYDAHYIGDDEALCPVCLHEALN